MWPLFQMKSTLFVLVIGTVLILARPFPSHAVLMEQMAVSTKAISLANTVTAYPPRAGVLHYNPAGLSHLPEGKVFANGNSMGYVIMLARFQEDPTFKGFMDTWGPGYPKRNNPHDLYQSDPLSGTESKLGGAVNYIPFYGPLKLPIAGPAPSMGLSYRAPGSKWTYAFGQYAPFGGGMYRKDDDPGRFATKELYLQHLIYTGFGTSCQVSDSVSLGLSVGFGQTALGANMDQRTPNDMIALTRVLGETTKDLEIPVWSELTLPPPWFGGGISPYEKVADLDLALRDDFSPNFNLGLLWEPRNWFSFGVCYQSPIRADLVGRYKMNYSKQFQKQVDWLGSSPLLLISSGMFDLPYEPVPFQTGRVKSTMEFPQMAHFGVMLRPIKRLKLLCDLHWADWSVWKDDRFVVDQDLQALKLMKMLGYPYGNRTLVMQRNMKDTLHMSFGLEFHATDLLSLRFGYEHRPTSVPDNLFSMMVPFSDLDNYGAGLEVTLPEGHKLELAVAYMVKKGYRVPNNTSKNLNSTVWTDIVYNPYAGLDYEQDFEAYFFSFTTTQPF